MDCAIWLNRRKIFSADEISENFDIAAIRGYFLGGSLIKWLEANGGEKYARLLKELSPSDPILNDRLTEIFLQKKCASPVHVANEKLIKTIELLRGGTPAVTGSAQAVNPDSFSPLAGSFGSGYGSFRSGSFTYGSFGSFRRMWEWEWEYGSFRNGSFSYSFGSYRSGSFAYGSFSYGSFSGGFVGGSLRSGFSYGSFLPCVNGVLGSYRGFPLGGISSDEYDEIMYRTLNKCPLNRFGYGIHLI